MSLYGIAPSTSGGRAQEASEQDLPDAQPPQAVEQASARTRIRNGLHEAVRELQTELIAIYAELDGAGEAPLRGELVKLITDRSIAFNKSCLAGVHGVNVRVAAREGRD